MTSPKVEIQKIPNRVDVIAFLRTLSHVLATEAAMIAFAGIDGTGVISNTQYQKDFKESHVSKLYRNWPWPELAFYSRGPSMLGLETGVLAQMAYGWCKNLFDKGKAKGIFLAGYSRGGAAAIEAANFLHGFFWNTQVNCLILFDAVDRSTEVGGLIFDTPVRGNVEICLHAMRKPEAKSRESFGNCGQTISDSEKTLLVSKKFFCTHGGVGGTPWVGGKPGDFIDEEGVDGKTAITYEQDQRGAKEVWDWIKPKVDAAIKMTQGKLKK